MFVIVLKVIGILILIEFFIYAVVLVAALVAALVKCLIPTLPTVAKKTARTVKAVANLAVSATRKVFSVVKFVVNFGK